MMPVQQQDKQDRDRKKQEREQQSAVIGKYVMHTLGQPGDLRTVQVKRLWEDHYRVNVLVGQDAASARVAHSFFLVADCDGKVVTCTPDISKKY
jgi:hypothetical protein